MDRLPIEIIEYVGDFLDVYDLHNLRSTCKQNHHYLQILFYQRMETIPWRIVIHAIDMIGHISIDDLWISIGNYENYKKLAGKTIVLDYFLDHERCSRCDDMKINNKHTHGDDLISKSRIITVIEEGIGGNVIYDIFELLKGESVNAKSINYIPVNFTTKSFFDGLIDDPSMSESLDSLEINFPLFVPATKNIIPNFDEIEIHKYPVETTDDVHISTSISRTIIGIFSNEKSKPKEYLGDYDLSKYNQGVFNDSEEDYDLTGSFDMNDDYVDEDEDYY